MYLETFQKKQIILIYHVTPQKRSLKQNKN